MMPCGGQDTSSQLKKVQRQWTDLAASVAHHGSSVVGCSDGLEPLLARCVPAHTRKPQTVDTLKESSKC